MSEAVNFGNVQVHMHCESRRYFVAYFSLTCNNFSFTMFVILKVILKVTKMLLLAYDLAQ
jgi:hypothetical protein